ncbi:MAG TPA: 50S ribosomal protein L5 [Patescibacteria group bacterium]|nr:50S ribosomal protein L5 [Patescibacteria group bacterium]
MENLQTRYSTTIKSELQRKLGINNPMAVPKLTKIVVNMGVKDAVADKKNIERAASALSQITGQKARIARAKKSVASFKLRQGDPIGVVVTLRGKRMYDFYEKMISIVFPRIKDFHGISRTSFDGRGNYSLGFSEYTVFPEIDPATVERVQGLEIVVVTSTPHNDQALALLEALGTPFEKEAATR